MTVRLLQLEMSRNKNRSSSMLSALQEVMDECDYALGSEDIRTLEVRKLFVSSCLDLNMFTEARNSAQFLAGQRSSASYRVAGLDLWAEALYALGEKHKAENVPGEGIKAAISRWGPSDPRIQMW